MVNYIALSFLRGESSISPQWVAQNWIQLWVKGANRRHQIAERYWLRCYRMTLERCRADGLTVQDLLQMVESGNFFSFNAYGSSRLKRGHRRLQNLKSYQRYFPNSSLEIRRMIRRMIDQPVHEWVPGYVSQQTRYPRVGLAPHLNSNEKNSHTLILYVIPSPFGFDWSSPRGLLTSTINYLVPGKRHYIGHVAVELRKNGKAEVATGVTGETNTQVLRELTVGRQGFSFLFKTFRGRVEKSADVLADLALHGQKRKLGYMVFDLTPEQYQRGCEFLALWFNQGQFRKYGLWQNPLRDEGAGCVSFGIAVLEKCGVLTSEMRQSWCRELKVSSRWLGPSLGHPPVGFLNLVRRICFTTEGLSWSQRGEASQGIQFWDPDLIYSWIVNQPHQTHAKNLKGIILKV